MGCAVAKGRPPEEGTFGGDVKAGGCRGAWGRDCAPARQLRQRRPQGGAPQVSWGSRRCVRGHQEMERRAQRLCHSKTVAGTGSWRGCCPKARQRRFDSWRRAPTRLGQVTPRSVASCALKGYAGKLGGLGRKAGKLALGEGVRAGDPWTFPRVSLDLSKFGRRKLPGT